MNTMDIAWLAGLWEGEGCFAGKNSNFSSPHMSIAMTDKDVLERAAGLMGREVKLKRRGGRFKDVWRFELYGRNAAGWMMTLYPLMGERRRKKIGEVIGRWRSVESRRSRRIFDNECRVHGSAEIVRTPKRNQAYCRGCQRERYKGKQA